MLYLLAIQAILFTDTVLDQNLPVDEVDQHEDGEVRQQLLHYVWN